MVTITVFFEGGAAPSDNRNADTVENTARLRESFNTLLNSGVENSNVKVQAVPAYSITNVKKIRQPNAFLLMDLDAPSNKKQKRITDNRLDDIQEKVFFMVQRMEAWILSQPDVIEKVFANFKTKDSAVADDESIKDKHPETILHPDFVLNVILQRLFSYQKGDKIKKLKYGKLKHAPQLIENLDLNRLRETFEDVQNLMQKINDYNKS